ncbi:MAG: aminotransferase class III-fold pyridoxal phosphate-dependent enzyme, partial [Tistlia sp.]
MTASPDPRPLGQDAHGGPVQAFFLKPGTARRPRIVRGEGLYMWDDAGRRYIDVSSGPVANNLGHGNRRVLDAMQRQAEAVTFAFPSLFETEANVMLSDLLTSLAGPGLERAFFVSGGSEATESAIKLCRSYALAKGEPARVKIIGREPGYHGATLGALAVTGDEHQHAIYGPLLRAMPKVPAPWTYRLPDNHTRESYARHCAQALEEKIQSEGPETILAFIMEPIGGLATGALVAEDVYYRLVREICSRHGVLLIYDEVMSGAGRSGTFLAADHWPDARPDLVILAKGIAAGYTPMGCVLAPAELVRDVAEAGGFMHGFTYYSNPLSCAIGHAVLSELVERDLMANAAARGTQLLEALQGVAERSALIGDIRGRGLLLAVELVGDKASKRQLPLELNAPTRFQQIAMDQGLAVYSRRTSNGQYGDWFMVS